MIYEEIHFENKLALLREMTKDNPAMAPIVDRVYAIPSIGQGYATMVIEELGRHQFLKYAIDPAAITDSSRPKSIAHNNYLSRILLRGIDAQHKVSDIPGVQPVYATGFYEDVPGLVGPFAFVLGFDLEKTPPFSDSKILEMFQNLEGTLEQMHDRGVGHWDIKPGNVIVSGGIRPTFIDFSLARRFNLQDVGLMGTVPYFHSDMGRSRDWFALAVTLVDTIFGVNTEDSPLIFLRRYKNHRNVPNKAGVAYFIADCANRLENSSVRELFLDWVNRPEEGTREPNLEWTPMDPGELARLKALKAGDEGGPEPTLASTRVELAVGSREVLPRRQVSCCENHRYSGETSEALSGIIPQIGEAPYQIFTGIKMPDELDLLEMEDLSTAPYNLLDPSTSS